MKFSRNWNRSLDLYSCFTYWTTVRFVTRTWICALTVIMWTLFMNTFNETRSAIVENEDAGSLHWDGRLEAKKKKTTWKQLGYQKKVKQITKAFSRVCTVGVRIDSADRTNTDVRLLTLTARFQTQRNLVIPSCIKCIVLQALSKTGSVERNS